MKTKKLFLSGPLSLLLFLVISCANNEAPFPSLSTTIASTTTSTTTSTTGTTVPLQFSAYITDLSKIAYITPIGSIGTHPDGAEFKSHSFFRITDEVTTVEVYSPVSAEVVEMKYLINRADNVPEYYLLFQINDNLFFYFDHLIDVNAEIKSFRPDEPTDDSTVSFYPPSPIAIQAGELIGSTEGTLQAHNWDFGAYDTSTTPAQINPARFYGQTSRLYGICPYQYYPESMKEQYLNLFADSFGTIIPGASCGSVSQDVADTAAGAWFLDSGTDSTYKAKFVIAKTITDNIQWGGVGSGVLVDRQTDTYTPIDPAEITAGESASYQDYERENYLFIKLLSATELGIIYGSGETPAVFPETGYKTYLR
ncbi:MAG: hypothetical protein ABH823_04270 [bacterium]